MWWRRKPDVPEPDDELIGAAVLSAKDIRRDRFARRLMAMSPEALVGPLKQEPQLIQEWYAQADKRVSYGWWFQIDDEGAEIGFHPDGPRFRFDDPVVACAHYAFREITDPYGRRRNG